MLLRLGIGLATAGVLSAAIPQAALSHSVGEFPPIAPSTRSRFQQQRASSVASPGAPQRALLARYCITCHNERLKTANLMLDSLDIERVADNSELWEKVVAKLRSGAMPPAGSPRPDNATYDSLASWLEAALDRAAAANLNPGRTLVRRVNRAEYANVIRDLLTLEVEASSLLPADNIAGSGFDNSADVLTVSPALLERYLSAARHVARLAMGDPTARPEVQVYRTAKNDRQEDRVSEDVPFGTRGGIAVRRHFPADGEYTFKIRFLRNVSDKDIIRGLHRPNEVDVRVDGRRVGQFVVGGGVPCLDQGLVGDGCFSATPAGSVMVYKEEPDAAELRVPVKAGLSTVTVAFAQKTLQPEGLKPRYPTVHHTFQNETQGLAFIDQLEIGGPYNVVGTGGDPLSRERILVCRPTDERDEETCAKTILSTLARRAYRRPPADADIQDLLSFFRDGRRRSGVFEGGIRSALERVLVSPQFLFRIERDPTNLPSGSAYRVSDLELASRVSFFLWSSIPDDDLLESAAATNLTNPAVLGRHVRRMLTDKRSATLVTNFVSQWLLLRNMSGVRPDPHEYPDFDDELREAFQRETELFVESQMREDHSVVDLLRANYTFLNERLARHYGIPGIYGRRMRRVTMTDDQRMGLLGHGGILTVTSYSNRTSPVLRGKWVLESILGAPPPAPPPNVPALEEQPAVKYQSMRQRMEQHRRNPACAACHARIDPLGFAMENFDGIGRWRDRDGGRPLDVSGVLDGIKFNGLMDLRKLLESRQEEFVTNVTKKLLTFALGRGVEHDDMPAVRQIVRQAAADDYRWSSLILGIVNSTPFRMRRAE